MTAYESFLLLLYINLSNNFNYNNILKVEIAGIKNNPRIKAVSKFKSNRRAKDIRTAVKMFQAADMRLY